MIFRQAWSFVRHDLSSGMIFRRAWSFVGHDLSSGMIFRRAWSFVRHDLSSGITIIYRHDRFIKKDQLACFDEIYIDKLYIWWRDLICWWSCCSLLSLYKDLCRTVRAACCVLIWFWLERDIYKVYKGKYIGYSICVVLYRWPRWPSPNEFSQTCSCHAIFFKY